MKKILILATLCSALFCSCASLRTPVVIKNAPIESFKYAYIPPTQNFMSSKRADTSDDFGISSYSSTKTVNPRDVIAGKLIKAGFVILPEVKPELANETLIVNYGESGRRNNILEHSIEVAIQFVSAKTYEPVCSCTAEGHGQTEADDIRKAIDRALSQMIQK